MNTSIIYDTLGSAGPYTVPVPYITTSDIYVRLDGVLTTAFTFPSATEVLLDSAPTEVEIEIRRITRTTPYINFADSGIVVETDLDTAFRQALYLAEEASDVAGRLSIGPTGPQGPPALAGSVTFSVGVTSITVIFDQAQPDTNYSLGLSIGQGTGTPGLTSYGWANKTTTGFDFQIGADPGVGNTLIGQWLLA